jgi:hypothetical protein
MRAHDLDELLKGDVAHRLVSRALCERDEP